MTTSVTPASLQPGLVLTTSNAVMVTGATKSQTIVKRAVFTNVTNAAVTFSVTLLPFGGSGLVIIPQRTIALFGTDLAPELSNLVLNGGDEIVALASAGAAVNAFASGFVST